LYLFELTVVDDVVFIAFGLGELNYYIACEGVLVLTYLVCLYILLCSGVLCCLAVCFVCWFLLGSGAVDGE
jgi:hypothetical protein